jgi:hypothetical protein
MKDTASPYKTVLLFSGVLIVAPFILIKLNLLSRSLVYSGSVHDALGMNSVDLVKLSANGRTTYTDKDGKFSLLIKSPIFVGSQKNIKGLTIEVIPAPDFEGKSFSVPCTPVKTSFMSTKVDCPAIVYPTIYNVAARVLATEISQGLFNAGEIAARKLSLWNLLSEQSRKQWKSRDEFVSVLTSQETDRAKIKSQPVSYTVSRDTKSISDYKYFGKYDIYGEVASVNASVTDASGRVTDISLVFVKEENIWRFLIPDRRNGKFL